MNIETLEKAVLVQQQLKEKRAAISEREALERNLETKPGFGVIKSKDNWVEVKNSSIKFVLHLELHQLQNEIYELEKEFSEL